MKNLVKGWVETNIKKLLVRDDLKPYETKYLDFLIDYHFKHYFDSKSSKNRVFIAVRPLGTALKLKIPLDIELRTH